MVLTERWVVVCAEWRSPEGERWGWTFELSRSDLLYPEACRYVLSHAQELVLEGFQLQDDRVRLEDVAWWVDRWSSRAEGE